MLAVKITALAICLIALFLTFKAKLIAGKLLGREPEEGMVLRVKYVALGLAVIAFCAMFIVGR